jgi:ribosomal protein L25 (general stress protein Ctc)
MLYTGSGQQKTLKEMRLARRKQAINKVDRKLRSLQQLIDDVYGEKERKVILNHLKKEVWKMGVRKDPTQGVGELKIKEE